MAIGTYTISAEPVSGDADLQSGTRHVTRGTQSVTLADTTSGAVIYYTTNGTTPTTSSSQYVSGTPLSISASTTIEAMAVASGYTNSTVAIGTYTITPAVRRR